MGHITTIGAGLYSDLAISVSSAATAVPGTPDAAGWAAHFASEVAFDSDVVTAGSYKRITNIREFPQMGTPPNIVNVPAYGSKTSRQVQGQADAPSFEVVINYIPDFWRNEADYLGNFVGNGTLYLFRFALLNAAPANYDSTAATGMGVGGVQNSIYYWGGKLEALQINPQLTDANQATLTISIQSDFYGAFTS